MLLNRTPERRNWGGSQPGECGETIANYRFASARHASITIR